VRKKWLSPSHPLGFGLIAVLMLVVGLSLAYFVPWWETLMSYVGFVLAVFIFGGLSFYLAYTRP
jgi:hypothetical protein